MNKLQSISNLPSKTTSASSRTEDQGPRSSCRKHLFLIPNDIHAVSPSVSLAKLLMSGSGCIGTCTVGQNHEKKTSTLAKINLKTILKNRAFEEVHD